MEQIYFGAVLTEDQWRLVSAVLSGMAPHEYGKGEEGLKLANDIVSMTSQGPSNNGGPRYDLRNGFRKIEE